MGKLARALCAVGLVAFLQGTAADWPIQAEWTSNTTLLDSAVTVIELSGRGITSVSSANFGTFCACQTATEIVLARNRITVVNKGAFGFLENLVKIDLSNNDITFIAMGAIPHIDTLEQLDLSFNFIAGFHFANYTAHLNYLDLSYQKYVDEAQIAAAKPFYTAGSRPLNDLRNEPLTDQSRSNILGYGDGQCQKARCVETPSLPCAASLNQDLLDSVFFEWDDMPETAQAYVDSHVNKCKNLCNNNIECASFDLKIIGGSWYTRRVKFVCSLFSDNNVEGNGNMNPFAIDYDSNYPLYQPFGARCFRMEQFAQCSNSTFAASQFSDNAAVQAAHNQCGHGDSGGHLASPCNDDAMACSRNAAKTGCMKTEPVTFLNMPANVCPKECKGLYYASNYEHGNDMCSYCKQVGDSEQFNEAVVDYENSTITNFLNGTTVFASHFCNDTARVLPDESLFSNPNNCLGSVCLDRPECRTKDSCPNNPSNITVIPDDMNGVHYEAFRDCSFIENVKIEEGILRIGDSAFRDSENLEVVVLPIGLRHISAHAFSGCTSLRLLFNSLESSVQGPNGVIDRGGFLYSFVMPNSVTDIGPEAFRNTALESVSVSNSLSALRENTFGDCPNLKLVDIPAGVDIRHTLTNKNGAFMNSQTIRSARFNHTDSADMFIVSAACPMGVYSCTLPECDPSLTPYTTFCNCNASDTSCFPGLQWPRTAEEWNANISTLGQIINLNLYERGIYAVGPRDFRHLPQNPTRVYLQHNIITRVEAHAFSDTSLSAVKEVILHNNRITFIAKDAFSDLVGLEKLDLQKNFLAGVDYGALNSDLNYFDVRYQRPIDAEQIRKAKEVWQLENWKGRVEDYSDGLCEYTEEDAEAAIPRIDYIDLWTYANSDTTTAYQNADPDTPFCNDGPEGPYRYCPTNLCAQECKKRDWCVAFDRRQLTGLELQNYPHRRRRTSELIEGSGDEGGLLFDDDDSNLTDSNSSVNSDLDFVYKCRLYDQIVKGDGLRTPFQKQGCYTMENPASCNGISFFGTAQIIADAKALCGNLYGPCVQNGFACNRNDAKPGCAKTDPLFFQSNLDDINTCPASCAELFMFHRKYDQNSSIEVLQNMIGFTNMCTGCLPVDIDEGDSSQPWRLDVVDNPDYKDYANKNTDGCILPFWYGHNTAGKPHSPPHIFGTCIDFNHDKPWCATSTSNTLGGLAWWPGAGDYDGTWKDCRPFAVHSMHDEFVVNATAIATHAPTFCGSSSVTTTAAGSLTCTQRTNAVTSNPFIDCAALQLNAVPTAAQWGQFSNIQDQSINLDKHLITVIGDTAFDDCPYTEATMLSLHDNQISQVGYRAFQRLYMLKKLHLSGNHITFMNAEALFGLPRLEELYLDFNKIYAFDYGSLAPMPALGWLTLHNQADGDLSCGGVDRWGSWSNGVTTLDVAGVAAAVASCGANGSPCAGCALACDQNGVEANPTCSTFATTGTVATTTTTTTSFFTEGLKIKLETEIQAVKNYFANGEVTQAAVDSAKTNLLEHFVVLMLEQLLEDIDGKKLVWKLKQNSLLRRARRNLANNEGVLDTCTQVDHPQTASSIPTGLGDGNVLEHYLCPCSVLQSSFADLSGVEGYYVHEQCFTGKDSGLSTGAIAGIAVGSVAFIAIVSAAVLFR